jgi:hypothetical protein
MNAATRGKLLEALDELGRQYPHWRFGQLVCNVAGWADADDWEAADEELLEALRKQDEYARRGRLPTPADAGSSSEGQGLPQVEP